MSLSPAMRVNRVEDDTGSHIEPPLDELWDNHDKLRWNLAVTLTDGGIPYDRLTIEPGHYTVGGVPQESYVIMGPGRVVTTGNYYASWTLINGIGLGLALAPEVIP